MKRTVLNLALFASLFMAASCSQNAEQKDSPEVAKEQNEQKFDDSQAEDDVKFAAKAAEGGLFEVELAKLAETKAVSPKVKELSSHILEDHTKANDELKALAASKNITLPVALGEEKQKKVKDLSEKNGIDFDIAYAECMVKDHKDDIDAFKKEGENGKDPELKTWAANKVSTLEHHLSMAEETEKAVKDAKKEAKN